MGPHAVSTLSVRVRICPPAAQLATMEEGGRRLAMCSPPVTSCPPALTATTLASGLAAGPQPADTHPILTSAAP
jgi:hypothetical protein